ncbi:MAG TPA: hypothetical protein VIG41_06775, partial [Micrococcaceae bacterium]
MITVATAWLGPLHAEPTFDVRPRTAVPTTPPAISSAAPLAPPDNSGTIIGDSPTVLLLSVLLFVVLAVALLGLILRRFRNTGGGPGSHARS